MCSEVVASPSSAAVSRSPASSLIGEGEDHPFARQRLRKGSADPGARARNHADRALQVLHAAPVRAFAWRVR